MASHMLRPARSINGRSVILFLGLLLAGTMARAQQAAALTPPADERQAQLAERNRLDLESKQLRLAGKLPEAIAAATNMLALERQLFGNEHDDVAGSLLFLGECYEQASDFAQAESRLRERYDIRLMAYGEQSWRSVDARSDLDYCRRLAVLPVDARAKLTEADRMIDQAQELARIARYPEALARARRAVELRRAVLDENDRKIANGLSWVGFILEAQHSYAEARPMFEQALAIDERLLGPEHPTTVSLLSNLATLNHAAGDDMRALPIAQRVVAIEEKILGADANDLAVSLGNLALVYKSLGLPRKAVPLLERALTIQQKTVGSEQPGMANTINSLAAVYHSLGQYAQALPLYRQALAIREKSLGDNHPATAESLNNLAALYFSMGKPADALALSKRVLQINEAVFGADHPAITSGLMNLGIAYQTMGDHGSAERLFDRERAIEERAWGVDHVQTTASLSLLGRLYEDQGKYADAQPLLEKALSIRDKALGGDNPRTIGSLLDLGTLYQSQGKYAAARALFERAMQSREKLLGEDHPETADVLEKLGMLYHDQGDDARALPLLERALATDDERLGTDNPRSGSCANSLAIVYQNRGDFAQARPLLERGRAIAVHAFGADHENVATAIGNLAALDQEQGNYAEALSLLEQAVAMKQKALGAEHPSTAETVALLASLYCERGDYAEALRLNQQVLAVREKALGAEHPRTAETVNELGNLYSRTGDDRQALAAYRRALAIREKTLGDDHPDTATSLNNLADYWRRHEQFAQAQPLYQRALAIYEKSLGPDHREVAIALDNLALLVSTLGDHAQALTLQRRALAISERISGPDHPDTALTLRNIAGLYQDLGDFSQSLSYYQRALAIREKTLGAEHPETAELLVGMAFLHQFHGDPANALPLYQRALAISHKNLELTADVQSEREQLSMVASVRRELDALLTLIVDRQGQPDDAYDEVVVWKGEVFARERAVQLARQTADPQLRRTFEELESVSTQLAKLALADPAEKDLAIWRSNIDRLNAEKDQVERQLSEQSAEFRRRHAQPQRGVVDVRQALPDEGALVDFLVYRHFESPAGGRGKLRTKDYVAAFIVRRDRPTVLLELGPNAPIESAIDSWRRSFGQPKRGGNDPANELRRLIWQPLEPHLAGARMILLSPDQALARFPWAALPGQEPGSYLCEAFPIVIVPAPQLLPDLIAAPPSETLPGASLLAVGDVDYGAAPGRAIDWLASRSAVGLDQGGQRMVFGPLANTRDEVVAIRDSFTRRYPGATVALLSKEGATKSAFERQASKCRWLHLATHGFFAPPDKKSALAPDTTADALGEFVSSETAPLGNAPGLLSGLALAGANTPSLKDEDDGILTATEVATLDLSNVDVAVLSACETGLGETAGGEGVLGLQRAFQLSGVRTTVTSLWSVSDLGTRVLMQHFYDNLWNRRMSKVEALRQAQLTLLNTPLEKLASDSGRGLTLLRDVSQTPGQRLPPYYWAAFMLSGDWR
jgi:tetratricopeptide (TPR) repeat protein